MTPPRDSDLVRPWGPSDYNDIAAVVLGMRLLPSERRQYLARQAIQAMVNVEAAHAGRAAPYIPRSHTCDELEAWVDRPIGDWPALPINEVGP